jgi:hypothetical protein
MTDSRSRNKQRLYDLLTVYFPADIDKDFICPELPYWYHTGEDWAYKPYPLIGFEGGRSFWEHASVADATVANMPVLFDDIVLSCNIVNIVSHIVSQDVRKNDTIYDKYRKIFAMTIYDNDRPKSCDIVSWAGLEICGLRMRMRISRNVANMYSCRPLLRAYIWSS